MSNWRCPADIQMTSLQLTLQLGLKKKKKETRDDTVYIGIKRRFIKIWHISSNTANLWVINIFTHLVVVHTLSAGKCDILPITQASHITIWPPKKLFKWHGTLKGSMDPLNPLSARSEICVASKQLPCITQQFWSTLHIGLIIQKNSDISYRFSYCSVWGTLPSVSRNVGAIPE